MSDRTAELLGKLKSRPQDTLARYSLAKDYHDRGAHEQAIEQFRILLEQKPDWMKACIHLGQSLAALGRGAEARDALERALALARAQHHEGPLAEIQQLLAGLDG